MRYTNYIINGDFNIDSIISKKVGIRQITILMSIPVALTGVVILTGILPFAIIADGERYTRLKYYQYLKIRQKEKQIKYIVKSFSLTKQQQYNLKSILINI